MPSFTLMTIAMSLTMSRCYRFCRALGAAAVAASVVASSALAIEKDEPLAPQPTGSHAAVFCNGIRPQDEIVVVNTRQICSCCDPEEIRNKLQIENYAVCDEAGTRHWQPGDLQSFLAFNPSIPTVIFVHGNQISPWDAKCEGVAVYRRIITHGCDSPPIRFVIFSWPSTKISGGLMNDIRVKAMRTGPAGCELAWLIDQMPAETPISLAGFSFGARIITGSLHILGGGSLGSSMFLKERVHPDRQPMSVILLASALHAHWLGDNQYHGMAMTQVSQMFLVNNCGDPAMKYYDYIEPGFGGPQALGLCGPTCITAENAHKIRMRDANCCVGDQHELMAYVCCNAGTIWDYTAGAAQVEVKSSK